MPAQKLIKNVAIAHSGVYTYMKDELYTLGLKVTEMPQQYQDMAHFNVYRPAAVLAKAAPLYTRLPVTVEHPQSSVNEKNSKVLMEGFTGDTATPVYRDGEVYIDSTLTLIAEDAIDYYERGYNQVSPGYTTKSKWLPEERVYKGMPYQIVVTDISEVNHLALCQQARGGPTTRVLDSKGGNMAKFKSGLFHTLVKKISGVKDSVSVRDSLLQLTKKEVTDEQITLTVDAVIAKATALPESEGREKLTRFLEDLKLSKSFDEATVKDAVTKTANLFEALDSAAEEDAKVTDYSPGATGVAGPGSQKMIQDEGEAAELVILREILAAIKALSGTTDAKPDDKKEKPPAAEDTKPEEKKPAAEDTKPEEKKQEEKKDTTDSVTATLDSTGSKKSSVDDFMAGFGK